jgi:hypothetical protein
MQAPDLDPYALAVSVAVLIVGPIFAPYLAAYTLIMFGWFGGVMVGVWRRPSSSLLGTLAFVIVTFVLTMGLTVWAAELMAPYVGQASRLLLIPVAVLIPAIGDDWISIGRWALGVLGRRIERKAESREQ